MPREPRQIEHLTRYFRTRKVPGTQRFELCEVRVEPGRPVTEEIPLTSKQTLGDCVMQGLTYLRLWQEDDEFAGEGGSHE